MPLTPADIHNMAFKKPPMGKRGYDEEEVDGFLDEVEQQLIRLLEENEALRGQMQRPGGAAPGMPGASLNAEFSAPSWPGCSRSAPGPSRRPVTCRASSSRPATPRWRARPGRRAGTTVPPRC